MGDASADRGAQPASPAVRAAADSGQRFAGVLAAADWSPQALALRLNSFAQANGITGQRVHPKTPYHWLEGRHPRQPWPELIAILLSTRLQTTITPADLGWTPSTTVLYVAADDGLRTPWTPEGTLRAATEVAHAGGVLDRRHFLAVAGAALTVPAHEWLLGVEGRPGAMAPLGAVTGAGRVQIDGALVHQLDSITEQLRLMDDSIGSTPVLDLAQAHVSHVTALLNDGRYTDQVGRRLHAVLAEVLRLCGWLSFDSGRHPDAQRYFLTALRAARTAGDDALGANIVAFMSCQAKELGHVHEAVTLAATAAAGHPHATGRPRAILDLRHAEASAHAHDHAAVRAHVDSAFAHLSDAPPRTPSSGEPDWCYWMNPAQAHGQAGYAYLILGDHAHAQQHLHAAANDADSSAGREGVLRSALLATAYTRSSTPDLDRALAAGNSALRALTESVASPRCVGYLTQFIATLEPHRRTPAVREFTDRAAAHLPPR